MLQLNVKFNMKGMIYGIFLIIFVLAGFIVLPKMFVEDIKPVDYVLVQRDSIPDKILDMMDDYIDQERALTIMIDDKVYVVVTRGQNNDYGIDVNKISIENREGKQVMKVEIIYKEKENAYPFVVLETNIKSLPDKVELDKEYIDDNKNK
ncbi:MAG: hypothetical protein SPD90_07940 [Intestinibacter sp.]|uniref:hypothetical protein n=1 Tax=Intestinibacter sp. TaxID=1965304 RepID=UPI002A830282|nr:hypothetical protein [Intestinibacter sp.]MDY4574975.1 hypothetical protein [Intestinibacter sp.]